MYHQITRFDAKRWIVEISEKKKREKRMHIVSEIDQYVNKIYFMHFIFNSIIR